jgi:hypothetical protein
MSKKYVPGFLKEQSPTPSNTASFWPGGNRAPSVLNTSNKFAALADDFPKEKPIVNTSLPAKQAPKLAPATLASLTSNGSTPITNSSLSGGSGAKKSFASKFKEQVRAAEDPNYIPPPKLVNFESEEDFPSLGGPGPKKNTVVLPPVVAPSTQSFAEKAKDWAKKKEDEEEKARLHAIHMEQKRQQAEITRVTLPMFSLRRYKEEYEDEEDDYNNNHEESSLGGDSDSYEVPECEPEDDEDEDGENGEFNQDVGWDGRKRGDLY